MRRKVVGCEIQEMWSVRSNISAMSFKNITVTIVWKIHWREVGMEKEEMEKLIRILRCY